MAAVDHIWNTEGQDLRQKFFYLDHTAEVLENYRRIKENEIFNYILHGEREKKAFLKKEGRKTENLIDNFDQRFRNYKYLAGTENPLQITELAGTKDQFLELSIIEN